MLAMAPTCLFAQHSARLDAPAEIHGVNLLFLDRTVAPTADFYRFSNGSWLDRAQIPHDQADISATAQARQRNEEMMWKLVVPTTIDYNAPAGSPEQLVGEFIRTGLNQVHADRLRFRPIEPELERIAGIQTRGDLIAEFAHLHRWGVDVAFRPYVDFDYKDSSHKIVSLFQGGLTLRDRDRYLSGDSKALSIKTRFSQCAQHMFALMGDSPESATRSAQRLLAIESRLAAMWKPEAELGGIEGNFHPCKLSALSTTAPKLDWTRYFASLGATDVVSVNADSPSF